MGPRINPAGIAPHGISDRRLNRSVLMVNKPGFIGESGFISETDRLPVCGSERSLMKHVLRRIHHRLRDMLFIIRT